jgi:hypothetical protein
MRGSWPSSKYLSADNNDLTGVAVLSECDTWAVGDYADNTGRQDAHRTLGRHRLVGDAQPGSGRGWRLPGRGERGLARQRLSGR